MNYLVDEEYTAVEWTELVMFTESNNGGSGKLEKDCP